jgi:integral membrane sensor domain MASE1
VHERIQFSIRTLLWLSLLVAVLCMLCRCLAAYVTNPTAQLASLTVGVGAGIGLILGHEHWPHSVLLYGVLLAGLLANGFWFEGAFPTYLAGVATGALAAWRGYLLPNMLFYYADLTVSVEKPGEGAAENHKPADGT